MQVVVETKLADYLIEKLDPKSDLLPMCKQEKLINAKELKSFSDGLRSRSLTKSAANTKLLKILQRTGNHGYDVFKGVVYDLADNGSARYQDLYRKINATETRILDFQGVERVKEVIYLKDVQQDEEVRHII